NSSIHVGQYLGVQNSSNDLLQRIGSSCPSVPPPYRHLTGRRRAHAWSALLHERCSCKRRSSQGNTALYLPPEEIPAEFTSTWPDHLRARARIPRMRPARWHEVSRRSPTRRSEVFGDAYEEA